MNYLVEQTLGPWFADAKAACGYPRPEEGAPTAAAAAAYVERLKAIRIADPACGSGAFLISAFRRLLVERIAAARDVERARGRRSSVRSTNRRSSPKSCATTFMASISTRRRSRSPSWRCGCIRRGRRRRSRRWNKRSGSGTAWSATISGTGGSGHRKPRSGSGPFDWRAAFPEVFPAGEGGGFDIVLGNPPYVKLQNLMKVDPDVVAYLSASRGDDTYASARTGNFDLYLPFIEKGLRLLAPGGRMAFIAPSLWAVNQYGEGLRGLVRRGRHLDRWLDFKAHQVFEDVITYTALQFFMREPQDRLRIAAAPNGEMADIDWSDPKLAVPYEAIPEIGEWLMATGAERALIERLARDCLRLDDPSLTTGIIVGIQTSADHIYHLKRLGTGRYKCTPKGKGAVSYEVEIEDAIMKPLVSGPEAKRYEEPETDTYLLFPYERDARGTMRLIPADQMAQRFPNAWAHLRRWEQDLRKRESNAFDDETGIASGEIRTSTSRMLRS